MTRITRRWGLLLWLTAVWVGLWGTVTWANVLGGLAVAVVLLLTLPLSDVPDRLVLRPLWLLRFLGYFAADLVKASLQVALLVVLPRRALRQAVLAVPVRGASDQLLTLLANAISLTPGTLTLEVDRPRSTLYVHVLDVGRSPSGVETVRRDILKTERLAILAVGSEACRRGLQEDLEQRNEVPR